MIAELPADLGPTEGDRGTCPECREPVSFIDCGGGAMWWHDDEVVGIDHEPNGPGWRVLPAMAQA